MRGYSYEFIQRVRALAKQKSAPLCVRLGLKAIEQHIPVITIAREIGVSRMAVYDWFTGKYEPSQDKLQRLQEYLNG